MSTENTAADSAEISHDNVKGKLKSSYIVMRESAANIQKTLDESQTGMLEIQAAAEELASLGPKGKKFSNRILASLEKAVAFLDLQPVPEALEAAAADVRKANAYAGVLIASKGDEVSAITDVLSEVQKSAAKNELHLPRPRSDLFPFEDGASDTFTVHNDPNSVLSRVRVITSTDGAALGAAVITLLKVDGPVVNYFYYTNYLELSEGMLGHEIDVSTTESVLVHKNTFMAAFALADALVTQFGALDASILQASPVYHEKPETPSDMLAATYDVGPEAADEQGVESDLSDGEESIEGDSETVLQTGDIAAEFEGAGLEPTSSVDAIAEAFEQA